MDWANDAFSGKVMPHISGDQEVERHMLSDRQRLYLWIESKECFDDKPTG